MHTVLSSRSREVLIGPDQSFCIIGERINPTGRKAFATALRAGDLSEIVMDVENQVAMGAHVLDVNMGVPLTDEADLLARAVTLVQEHTDLPLCIDSSVVEALEAPPASLKWKVAVTGVVQRFLSAVARPNPGTPTVIVVSYVPSPASGLFAA